MGDNENTTTQNLWDAAKAIPRRKFIAVQFYLNKQEKHQIDNLALNLKQLEEEEDRIRRKKKKKKTMKKKTVMKKKMKKKKKTKKKKEES